MSRAKQSRAGQRQLERDLFGPEPKATRQKAPRKVKVAPEPPPGRVGSCWACGGCCCTSIPWHCSTCGVTYPAVPQFVQDDIHRVMYLTDLDRLCEKYGVSPPEGLDRESMVDVKTALAKIKKEVYAKNSCGRIETWGL